MARSGHPQRHWGVGVRWWVGALVAVFAAAMAFGWRLGIRYDANSLEWFWQYLDIDLLRHDLARSLWHLHSQPPLFNAYLGVMAKVFQGAGLGVAFQASFWAIGLGTLLAMACSMRLAGAADGTAVAACAVFALLPGFMVYCNWLFYTLPVALGLTCAGLSACAYASGRGAAWAHCFWWSCAAVVLTRASWHPVWMLAVGGALCWCAEPRHRRAVVIAGVVPFIAVNAWYAKNLVQVGWYSSSTWVGMNLARGWTVAPPRVAEVLADHSLPSVWLRGPFGAPEVYAPLGYFGQEALRGSLHPSEGAFTKGNGQPNYNCLEYVRVSRDMLRDDMALIRRLPREYVKRALTAYLFFTQPGPNSTHFLVHYDFSRVHAWRNATTRVLFAGRPFTPGDRGNPPLNALGILYVPAIGALLVASARFRHSGRRAAAALCAVAALTALWGLAASVLAEVGENDRMRWESDPLVLAGLVAAGSAVVSRWRCRRSVSE